MEKVNGEPVTKERGKEGKEESFTFWESPWQLSVTNQGNVEQLRKRQARDDWGKLTDEKHRWSCVKT